MPEYNIYNISVDFDDATEKIEPLIKKYGEWVASGISFFVNAIDIKTAIEKGKEIIKELLDYDAVSEGDATITSVELEGTLITELCPP